MNILFLSFLATALAQSVSWVTVAPPSPTTIPEWTSDSLFRSAVLNSTNAYRAEHNASALAWNASLASFAAHHLSDRGSGCTFEHSGGPHGENLAMGYANVTASVAAWGDEREMYDYDGGEFSSDTGHFTQLVWADTEDVGCERRLCEGRWYLACEYYPRGNVIGEFETMVNEEVDGLAPRARPVLWMLAVVMAVLV